MLERTCVGCRLKGPKDGFVRIVRASDGTVEIDRSGKAPGRGAYVHPDVRCFEQAIRRGRLARALRTEIGGRRLDGLRDELEGAE